MSPCDERTKRFIDKIIPNKYRNKSNNYYLENNDELFKPVDLLNDDYFSDFFNKPDINTMEIMSNEDEYMYGSRKINKSPRRSVTIVWLHRMQPCQLKQPTEVFAFVFSEKGYL